jgi:hypothetical protein
MNAKQPGQLLYDSEATLRLVDSAILEFGEVGENRHASDAAGGSAPAPVARTSQRLERGYSELIVLLDNLRRSRSLLERWTLTRGARAHAGSPDVSGAADPGASGFASAVLLDLEQRLLAIVRILDPATPVAAGQQAEPFALPTRFDPDAGNRVERVSGGAPVATRARTG